MAGVYIATKKASSLMVNVWCVRVGHSPRAQCTKNVHPLVLSVFFFFVSFFENRRPHAEPRVSEKQKEKKVRPKRFNSKDLLMLINFVNAHLET